MFDLYDNDVCDKLVKSISNKQFESYRQHTSYLKLDFDDFVQQSWVAVMDCRQKEIDNLDYLCVSIRHAIWRMIKKTAIIQTDNKKISQYYIAGHDERLDAPLKEDSSLSLVDFLASSQSIEKATEDKLLVEQILSKLRGYELEEAYRIMAGLPIKHRKARETLKDKAKRILDGYIPKVIGPAPFKSDVNHVTYDKSKDRWVYSKRIEGKVKVFLRDKSKEVVEQYALDAGETYR